MSTDCEWIRFEIRTDSFSSRSILWILRTEEHCLAKNDRNRKLSQEYNLQSKCLISVVLNDYERVKKRELIKENREKRQLEVQLQAIKLHTWDEEETKIIYKEVGLLVPI